MEGASARAAVFEPVRASTAFEGTVERLGTAIRVGLLPSGARLPPERELAAMLGISRSTLRQALTTLVQSGHLVSTRGRAGGTFVAESPPLVAGSAAPDPPAMAAVLDHRVAIEAGSALLAAERAGPADLEALSRQVGRMSDASEFDAYRRADIGFHIALAEAAHSPRLVAAMTGVQGEVSELIALIAHPEQVLAHSNAQHGRLVDLLRRRDRARAVRLIREHVEGTERILAGLLPRLGPAAASRAGAPRARSATGQLPPGEAP